MGAFSALPQSTDPNIVDQLHQQYPSLKQYGIQFLDSTSGADHMGQPYSGRMLEFYPPNESWNPKKGAPTIEQFDKKATSSDAFGEIFSHYLPSVDPVFSDAKKLFLNTLDPGQKQMLQGDYQHQLKSGVFGDSPPTLQDWLSSQGGDAFFRGYVTKQYPEKFYRQDQIDLFNSLMNRLK